MLTVLVFLSTISFFFFNDTATTYIYTLSLHDAFRSVFFGFGEADQVMNGIAHLLSFHRSELTQQQLRIAELMREGRTQLEADRKSTRLNSSHPSISYAVFCLKKKKK